MKVFTAGVFDLFHVGHLRLLEHARTLGDVLVVGVLTDDAAAKYKDRPIVPFAQRLAIVNALKCVDETVVVHDTDCTELLKRIQADVLVHGDDLLKKSGWEIGQTYMRRSGRRVALPPYTPGVSTTAIKRRICGLEAVAAGVGGDDGSHEAFGKEIV
jgi:rfaE bifunctional protein nucleotidyltransferase chain/domain